MAKDATVNTDAAVPALTELDKLSSGLVQQREDKSHPIINKLFNIS